MSSRSVSWVWGLIGARMLRRALDGFFRFRNGGTRIFDGDLAEEAGSLRVGGEICPPTIKVFEVVDGEGAVLRTSRHS